MPGASACVAKLIAIANRINNNTRKAVEEVTDEIFIVSTENFCPVDKGNLKKSAKKEKRKTSTEHIVIISYNTPYCWYVHELPYRHVHGQRKYLEVPVRMYKNKLVDSIKSAYMEAL